MGLPQHLVAIEKTVRLQMLEDAPHGSLIPRLRVVDDTRPVETSVQAGGHPPGNATATRRCFPQQINQRLMTALGHGEDIDLGDDAGIGAMMGIFLLLRWRLANEGMPNGEDPARQAGREARPGLAVGSHIG